MLRLISKRFANTSIPPRSPGQNTMPGAGILNTGAIYIPVRERARDIEPVRDFEQP